MTPLDSGRNISRQRVWKLKKRAGGRCITCGELRGKTGTSDLCRECADKQNAHCTEYRRRLKELKEELTQEPDSR